MVSKCVNEEAAKDVTNGMLGTALTKKKTSSMREAKYKRSAKHTPEELQGVPKETNVLTTTSSGMKVIQQIETDAMYVKLKKQPNSYISKYYERPGGLEKHMSVLANVQA